MNQKRYWGLMLLVLGTSTFTAVTLTGAPILGLLFTAGLMSIGAMLLSDE